MPRPLPTKLRWATRPGAETRVSQPRPPSGWRYRPLAAVCSAVEPFGGEAARPRPRRPPTRSRAESRRARSTTAEGPLLQRRGKLVALVAPEVPRFRVRRSEPVCAGGTLSSSEPCWPHERRPVAERRRIVLAVLEHLEGADQVERGAGRQRVEAAAEIVSTRPPRTAGAPSRTTARRARGRRIVAPRGPDAERALSCADLEHRSDVVELRQQPADRVVPKPPLDRQRRVRLDEGDQAGIRCSGPP